MFMADKEFRGNVAASAPTGVLVLFDHLTIGGGKCCSTKGSRRL